MSATPHKSPKTKEPSPLVQAVQGHHNPVAARAIAVRASMQAHLLAETYVGGRHHPNAQAVAGR